MKSRQPIVIEVMRGSVVESTHQVMAVIADDRGLVHGYHGNVDYLTYPRSCIKLLQALPLVESGALEKFGLDDKMLALACSSHTGEKQHLLVVHQWMERLQAKESWLHCGPAWPAHEATQHEMIRKNLQPSPLLNNCSGKHLGFIAACLAHGENPQGYEKWEHPLQVRLRKVLSETMRVNHERLPWGVDGCGIPTYAVPLQAIAIGMASLLSPGTETRKVSARRILDACRKHPTLLAGSDEFVSIVNEKTGGRVILKSGAEGVYSALIPEKGMAFAVKVADGHWRAAEVACAHLLRSLGGITEQLFFELKEHSMPAVMNSRGEKVGEIRLQKGTT
ncbi:MAG: asparaginase [Bdellovibrionaceae bacterium]|nr:asparaginase [Pseudobdellovibrionaceae bacterium]MBX3033192.1 asparaginase [Pseudobdellovibrionaceae bacterium]